MRAWSAVLLFAGIAWAQPAFENLAPNRDGSLLWFSSSLRLKGSDQFAHPKIFVWDESEGVRLCAQEPATITRAGPYLSSATAYRLIAASVSSDGLTIAIVGQSDCSWGTPCAISIEQYRSEIRRPAGEPLRVPGFASLAPSGRFAVLTSSTQPVLEPAPARVLDVTTGQEFTYPVAGRAFRRHRITNDGSFLRQGRLQRATGDPQPVTSDARIFAQAINDAGNRAFATTTAQPPDRTTRLLAVDIPTGRTTELAAAQGPIEFDISDDGTLIAYADVGDLWTVRHDGGGRQRVAVLRDSIHQIAVSGSGNAVFVNTQARLLRVDVRTLDTVEIAPPTLVMRPTWPFAGPAVVVPGGRYELQAEELPGIREVRLLGRTQHVLSSSATTMVFQAPYDMPDNASGWIDLVIDDETNSPFESSMLWPEAVVVRDFAPDWYRSAGIITALHEDFSAPVTRDNPARPGEIVHVYGTGFGRVSPAPELGVPAAAEPLSRVIAAMDCRIEKYPSPHEPVEVLFAGLAPGYIGLFQFDLRLPATASTGDAMLSCGRADDPAFVARGSGLLPIGPSGQ
ncbi:MAG TPA: hypothetical protein VFL57_10555 [Bryobacteraceae bacterium]|nr:hypothetical protein [Bryobacteraceae bacterium]